MTNTEISQNAATWALAKVGCAYSQAKRTQPSIFDCSSLVARAYAAQGKRWRYGGSVPISMYEVYDDDFELLWPETYAAIGRKMGGKREINLARQPGDVQFLCTDSGTDRNNRITHVAMVADESGIVHARGTKYGVCTGRIDLYSGKLCAVSRYNPSCPLRQDMRGWRTLALQRALNIAGADLSEDGEFGGKTALAVKAHQVSHDLPPTGIADARTLESLGLASGQSPQPSDSHGSLRVTGEQVNLRSGPGTEYPVLRTARKGEMLRPAETDGWVCVAEAQCVYWISARYVEAG